MRHPENTEQDRILPQQQSQNTGFGKASGCRIQNRLSSPATVWSPELCG